jgi:hemerythrin superfamily protein
VNAASELALELDSMTQQLQQLRADRELPRSLQTNGARWLFPGGKAQRRPQGTAIALNARHFSTMELPPMSTIRTTSQTTGRTAASARTEVLTQLMEDHKRVKKAYRDFQKLDADKDPEGCQALVLQVLDELTVHATLEEELLYPAARGALADASLVGEAEVEHESVRALIEQLRDMSPEDDRYAARFTVLCEYVMHHVKEEESEMFPLLEKARLGWEAMATEMNQRREEFMPAEGAETEPASASNRHN